MLRVALGQVTMESKRCSWELGVLAWLWGAAAAATLQEEPIHFFSQVFYCQGGSPYFGFTQTLDNDLVFSYDFPNSSWIAHLPDFQPEAPSRVPSANVSNQRESCGKLLNSFTTISDLPKVQMPESKGIPQVDIFTRYPLELGTPNTLICSVTNLFPPTAGITWTWNGEPVTRGVFSTQAYPVGSLDFELFSYLEVSPQEGDVYSCSIRDPGDTYNRIAYWVPRDPVPSDFLATLVCGVAIAVGVLFVILGIILIVKSRMPRSAE